MNLPLKIRWSSYLGILLVLFSWSLEESATAQEIDEFAPSIQIKRIRIGPHPKYTRILVDLNATVFYQVRANFPEKKIDLIFDDSALGPKVTSRKYRDKNLEAIGVRSVEGQVTLTFRLKNSNTRFFHYQKTDPAQVVLDLKGLSEPYIKARIGGIGKQDSAGQAVAAVTEEKPQGPKTTRVKGLSPKQVEEIVQKDTEDKIKNGWTDYTEALKKYQEQDYPVAVIAFRKFAKKYPDSSLLSDVLYLLAEAEFLIAWREPNPVYERALNAYQRAMRTYPKSRFYDHALYKLGFIFDELGYILEARTLYEKGLKQNKKSIYNKARKNSLAAMLMKEKRFEEAYKAFQAILKKSPKNTEARSAIFEIANHYFNEKDFSRAIQLYEDGARRWPAELSDKPIINFNMAEIYFKRKDYPRARKFYFDMINLDPASDKAHRALNRIGDTYLIEGKDLNALSVFNQSAKLDPENRESQYGQIRLADIGVRNPRLPVHDVIFDVNAYFEPFKTYRQIFESAKDTGILAEATLSHGIAFLKEQNYLKAIQEFKKLLPMGKDSAFHRSAAKYIHQAIVFMVDGYARQGGVLPILYSYSDYASLSIGKIKNLKTILQIGEAYQAVGMLPEAVRFYEEVKRKDTRKTYNDRIFLNLGKIHFERKNFAEAERVAQSFLQNYPRSPRIRDAMKLLADSFNGLKQYDDALKTYQDILKRFPEDPSEIHYLIGTMQERRNRISDTVAAYRKAIDTFDRTAKIVPEYVRNAYYFLGNALYQTAKFAESTDALSAAIRLFPDHRRRDWSELILADALEKIQNKQKATDRLNNLVNSETGDDLMKQAAQARLKMMEWEKEFKGSL
ncbi:hypothetical protein UR09_05765 [Candidatus Nitromaritima sp. SCGC AAA799-A02]|nr:hypothetical protein UR09_05765 [Candidatus Nitromaritima sp. SCGC AAA799-A02]